MRVIVWPGDESACGHYRLIFPAAALAAEGADIVVDFDGPTLCWSYDWSRAAAPPPDVRVLGLSEVPEADVVVMQRPSHRWWPDAIPYLQDAGVAVVVDVDDRFDRVPTANVAHDGFDPRMRAHANYRWITEACRRADLVTATTPALAKHYGHGHGLVLPNLVPQSYLSVVPTRRRENTVGWTGHIGVHPDDLESTKGGIAAALDGTGWGFHVVGSNEGVPQALGMPPGSVSDTGRVAFSDWMPLVAELAIGTVPLADSVFNQSKSSLKASEYASVGVPVVMSPIPDNLRLHDLGVGLVASSRNQWRRQLQRLMGSLDLRAEVAGRGREVMAMQTYERQAWRWADAWESSLRKRAAA